MEGPGNPGTNASTSACTNAGTNSRDVALMRLLEKQLEEVDTLTKKIDLWTKYQGDYEKLKKLIWEMQQKVRHQHRIPIAGTQLAFMKGHLIHTNELTVLLGYNYFALRSTRQADQIIERRLTDIKERLKMTRDAKKKTEDWFKISGEHLREREEFVEIIETA